MTFNGRLRLLVLIGLSLLYFLLNAFTFNALGVVLPYMVEELGWNWSIAGFGFTLLGLACGLSGLLPAILIRKFGVSKALLIGGVVLLAGFAGLSVTEAPWTYYACTVLIGVGYSICGQVPAVSVISHSFGKKKSTAMGFYFTAGGLGAVAGPLLAYAAQEVTGSWRLFWAVAALCAIVLAAYTSIVSADRWNPMKKDAGEEKSDDTTGGWSAKAAYFTPQYIIVVGAFTAYLLINTSIHGFAVQHMSDSGLGMGMAATVMSAIALISAGASAVAGYVGEKITAKQMTILSLGLTAIGTLGLMAGGTIIGIAIATIGLGIGFGFFYVSVALLLLDLFGKKPYLQLYSVMSLISTAAASGPAVAGMVRDNFGSFSPVLLACAAIGLAFVLALALSKPPKRIEEDSETLAAPQAL